MQTQAEQVKRAVEGLGEPTRAAKDAAREAMFASLGGRRSERGRIAHAPRHNTGRLLLIAAAVLLASVVGALAGGYDNLFGGPPAPPAIQRLIGEANDVRSFASWASPRIIASQTHRLMRLPTGRGDLSVWIAPTRDGNVCVALQHPGEHSLAAACLRPESPTRIQYTVDYSAAVSDLRDRSIWGRVPASAKSLELTLADHRTRAVDVQHGFFVAPIGGGDPTLLVARDSANRILARQPVWPGELTSREAPHLLADGSPSSIVRDQAHTVVRARTWAGDVTFSSATSVYGGSCDWITFRSTTDWVQCRTGFEPAVPINMGFSTENVFGSRPVALFHSYLPPGRLSAVRFHFADGRSVLLRPHGGWILYAFPPMTGLAAHKPLSYDLLGPAGGVVTHVAFNGHNSPEFGAALDRNNEIEHWTQAHPGYQPLR